MAKKNFDAQIAAAEKKIEDAQKIIDNLEAQKRALEAIREQRRVQITGEYILQAARQDDDIGEQLRRDIEAYVAKNVKSAQDVALMQVVFTLPALKKPEKKLTLSEETDSDGSTSDDAEEELLQPGTDVKLSGDDDVMIGEPVREKHAADELPETEAKSEDVETEGDANVSSESVSTSTTGPANDQEGVSDIADEQTDSDPENIGGDTDQQAPSEEPDIPVEKPKLRENAPFGGKQI